MSIEQTLYETLRDDATVGGLVSTRIYPNVAPDNASAPYITYQLVVGVPHNLIDTAPTTERKVLQINCISNSYANAKAIAVACKSAINGVVGYVTSEGDDYFQQTEQHRARLDVSLIG